MKDDGAEVLLWWEYLVKGGIKQIAIQRGKELKKLNLGRLNMLKLRQINLTSRVNSNVPNLLTELTMVNLLISEWYEQESSAITLMSRSKDLNLNEKVRIFHHGQHHQFRKRSSILKLQTPNGIVQGHEECARALENNVSMHLLNPADLNPLAQEILLKEVEVSFTDEDNIKLRAMPNKVEVKKY